MNQHFVVRPLEEELEDLGLLREGQNGELAYAGRSLMESEGEDVVGDDYDPELDEDSEVADDGCACGHHDLGEDDDSDDSDDLVLDEDFDIDEVLEMLVAEGVDIFDEEALEEGLRRFIGGKIQKVKKMGAAARALARRAYKKIRLSKAFKKRQKVMKTGKFKREKKRREKRAEKAGTRAMSGGDEMRHGTMGEGVEHILSEVQSLLEGVNHSKRTQAITGFHLIHENAYVLSGALAHFAEKFDADELEQVSESFGTLSDHARRIAEGLDADEIDVRDPDLQETWENHLQVLFDGLEMYEELREQYVEADMSCDMCGEVHEKGMCGEKHMSAGSRSMKKKGMKLGKSKGSARGM